MARTPHVSDFDLDMCFAPERRAISGHPNLEKWSEHVAVCTFWVRKLSGAVLYILHWNRASRHSGVQWITHRFREPFRPPPPDKYLENTCLSLHFACPYLLSSDSFSFSSTFFYILLFFAFHFSISSEVCLLNFFRWIANSMLHLLRLSSRPKTTKLQTNKATIRSITFAPCEPHSKILKRFGALKGFMFEHSDIANWLGFLFANVNQNFVIDHCNWWLVKALVSMLHVGVQNR